MARLTFPGSFIQGNGDAGDRMLRSRLRRQFVVFAIALFAAGEAAPYSRGQNITNSARAASAQSAMMRQVARKSAFIFSGTVRSVEWRRAPAGVGIDTVRVAFTVHEAVRGAFPGKTFIMQEWAGLWSSSAGRFRPGQRVFLFLYPRSKLGLTSVVGGDLGRYDLDSNWRIAGTNRKPLVLLDQPQRRHPAGGSNLQPRGAGNKIHTE